MPSQNILQDFPELGGESRERLNHHVIRFVHRVQIIQIIRKNRFSQCGLVIRRKSVGMISLRDECPSAGFSYRDSLFCCVHNDLDREQFMAGQPAFNFSVEVQWPYLARVPA